MVPSDHAFAESSPADDLRALERLAAIADGLARKRLATDARELAERIAEGRFFVACVGEFKRGKSSLVNALVGDDVLPVGIVPVTAVPTIVRFGTTRCARVRLAGRWESIDVGMLETYVSEEYNAENARGVEAVEVFIPSPLLRDGLCLVDTPGLGSIHLGNSAATINFVPQIDAAIAVIGVDPPLSGEELALIERIARHVRDIIVVLNKADRFTAIERAKAVAFASRALTSRLGGAFGQVLEISSIDQLQGPEDAVLDRPALVQRLRALGETTRRGLVADARRRGVATLAGRCLRALEEARLAIWRPMAESQDRIGALRIFIGRVAHHSLVLRRNFDEEERLLYVSIRARHKKFLENAIPAARAELARSLAASGTHRIHWRRRHTGREQAIEVATSIARASLLSWAETESEQLKRDLADLCDRFESRTRTLLEELAGLEDFTSFPLADYLADESGDALSHIPMDRRPIDLSLLESVHVRPNESASSRSRLGRAIRQVLHPRTVEGLAAALAGTLTTATIDARSAVEAIVAADRRRIELRMQTGLADVFGAAEANIERNRRTQSEGEGAAYRELEDLMTLTREIRGWVPDQIVKSVARDST